LWIRVSDIDAFLGWVWRCVIGAGETDRDRRAFSSAAEVSRWDGLRS
jgi:hypothetical protein